MSVSARKSSATNGRTPLRLGRLLRTSRSRVSHLKSLLMDNVAYYEHARLTVRHSSGTSFTPGAPLHSACLGSPEFYRRNKGDGWLGYKILRSFGLRPWIFLRDEPEQTKTKVNPRRFGYVQIIHYRCIGVYFYLTIYTGYLLRRRRHLRRVQRPRQAGGAL